MYARLTKPLPPEISRSRAAEILGLSQNQAKRKLVEFDVHPIRRASTIGRPQIYRTEDVLAVAKRVDADRKAVA